MKQSSKDLISGMLFYSALVVVIVQAVVINKMINQRNDVLAGYYGREGYICVKTDLTPELFIDTVKHEECHALINNDVKHFCEYNNKGFVGALI